MTSGIIKTLLVGCGNIAGGFDMDQNGLPFTHAGAYKNNLSFDIIGCIDPDKKKLSKFSKYWSIKYKFSNLHEAKNSNLDFDVISICSPTLSHFENIVDAIKLKPKVIFCEKPLTKKYEDAVTLKNMCEKEGIILAVNYNRRWDPEVAKLKNEINKGELGSIRSVIGRYNKGILNNGSHMVDLLNYLFGSLKIVTAMTPISDFSNDDPTITALLKTNDEIPIHLTAAHASDNALFELELIGSKKTKSMRDGGLNWSSRMIVENQRFKGYKNLGKEVYSEGRYLETMTFAVENIYNFIAKGEKIKCTGQEACAALKICFDLKKFANLSSNKK